MHAYHALHLSPMIPSTNIRETSRFFEARLGFTNVRDDANYVILTKDGVMVHLLGAGDELREQDVYLEVDNVDQVWESLKGHVQGMRVKAPFDREYGMRELHIVLPHTGTLLFIGQVITR